MDYWPPAGVDLSRTYDEIIFDNETADNIDNKMADNNNSRQSAMAQDSGARQRRKTIAKKVPCPYPYCLRLSAVL